MKPEDSKNVQKIQNIYCWCGTVVEIYFQYIKIDERWEKMVFSSYYI